jgi:multidrug efflux pump
MKSFTDLFVRRPVLAIVVSVVIMIAGLAAWRSLSVRQYPRSENASVTVATVYVGASADVVRGFVTTAIERSISSAGRHRVCGIEEPSRPFARHCAPQLNYDQTKPG